MKCANKALWVMVIVSSIGLWGCTQNGGSGSAKLRDLESRHAKLEEDYRATIVAREQARKRLAGVEEQRAKLTQELEAIVKEREDLRKQLTARINERDTIQAQLMQFSKELQSLLGKVEAAVQASGAATANATPVSLPAVQATADAPAREVKPD